MTGKSQQNSAKSLEAAAAAWVARLDAADLTQAEQLELESWLNSDTRCAGAFARARAVFVSPDLTSALRATRRLPSTSVSSAPFFNRGLLAAAAAVVATVVGTALLLGQRDPVQKAVYSSELGEIRQIPLTDGTRVTLNTNSVLQVEYSRESRLVTLDRGEAYFEVAKDPQRPFIVVGSSAQARAVGTSYDVRLGDDDGEMRIRVMSGRVAVESPPSKRSAAVRAISRLFGLESARGAYLNVNQEAEVRVGKDGPDKGEIQVSIRELSPAVFERSLMWREGMLSFEGVTLADAIAEFARYSRQQIFIRGTLANEHVSGLFAASDPATFARAIAISLKAKIKTDDQALILYR
jgi:transmembrane sensor